MVEGEQALQASSSQPPRLFRSLAPHPSFEEDPGGLDVVGLGGSPTLAGELPKKTLRKMKTFF